jgi:hypothetical protein
VEVSRAYLLDGATGQMVDAQLWDAITGRQLSDWENEWMPALQMTIERIRRAGLGHEQLPQSSHWDWRRKVEHFRDLLANPSFSVMCQDMTQGMMILDTLRGARLVSQHRKPVIYVEYLENAPWNRRHQPGDQPRFCGVGSLLMRAAIELSIEEGFKGRVGLHALPQSIPFYVNHCGMVDLGADASYQNLRYLELTPEQADAFITKGNKQ